MWVYIQTELLRPQKSLPPPPLSHQPLKQALAVR